MIKLKNKTELADLKKKVEELEKKRDFLLIEQNQLQKDKDRLLEEHMKAVRENMEEYQKMTSRILTSQDARDVLKNITFIQNVIFGSQTNTEITWKNNQISDSEINANSNVLRENSSEGTSCAEMCELREFPFPWGIIPIPRSSFTNSTINMSINEKYLSEISSCESSITNSTINGVPVNRVMDLTDEEEKLIQTYRKIRNTGKLQSKEQVDPSSSFYKE